MVEKRFDNIEEEGLLEFIEILKKVFFELRPSFKPSVTPLADDPVFKKLVIIDRTVTDIHLAEMGYLLWQASGRDLDKFFDLLEVKSEDGKFTIVEKNDQAI